MYQSNTEALIALTQASIASAPYEFNGSMWCRLPHADRAKAIGCDESTIRRLVSKPPFVSDRVKIGGIQTSIVRVGEPTSADLLRIHAKLIAKKFNEWLADHIPKDRERLTKEREKLANQNGQDAKERIKAIDRTLRTLKPRLPDRDFGLVVELAKKWPEGLHASLIAMVLTRWSDFMGRVKIVQAEQLAKGEVVKARYYEHPFIVPILNYADVAIAMMVEHYQETGKTPPAALQALHPHLWKHLKSGSGGAAA